jgi:perosamine synthetase
LKFKKPIETNIPYSHQSIDEADIQAVADVLRSDWLTTGPKVEQFEKSICEYTGAKEAVAVSSGTAALHTAMYAIDIQPGDEVILPPITFAATANSVCFLGGTPVFADVEPGTLLIDPSRIEDKISEKTKAIVGVDYAGQPCDWGRLREIADAHKLALVADSCQALGAEYRGKKAGSLADMTAFSFHPVKHITTGEGGMITTDNPQLATRMRRFRNHGIDTDFRQREETNSWFYGMTDLGYNYRLTDIQSALGLSQLKRLPTFLEKRDRIARLYDKAFENNDAIIPLQTKSDCRHAYHLYVVRIDPKVTPRDRAFTQLRKAGIGVNVHHIPVYLHPYYKTTFGHTRGLCPIAEQAFEEIISLPIWPGMGNKEIETVIEQVNKETKKQ